MEISPVYASYISKLGSLNTSKHISSPRLKEDVFVRRTPSSRNFDPNDNSYNAFVKWSEETDFLTNARGIISKNGEILGSGFEGTTYAIPNSDNWVIKQFKRSSMVRERLSKPSISKVKDISPDLNIGQFIASVKIPVSDNYVEHFYVLKKQEGKSYGVPLAYAGVIDDITVKQHLSSLKKLAELPQSSYLKLIDDISYVTKRGYAIDATNPYNFMIDDKAQSINMVDIQDKLSEKRTQYADVLYALLDGKYAKGFDESSRPDTEKQLARNYSNQICGKFISAMIRKQVHFDNSGYFSKVFINESFENAIGAHYFDEKIQRLKDLGLYK